MLFSPLLIKSTFGCTSKTVIFLYTCKILFWSSTPSIGESLKKKKQKNRKLSHFLNCCCLCNSVISTLRYFSIGFQISNSPWCSQAALLYNDCRMYKLFLTFSLDNFPWNVSYSSPVILFYLSAGLLQKRF